MPSWKKLVVSGSDATLRSLNLTENLTVSGSTFFGDENTDIHSFTGSIQVSGSISAESLTGSLQTDTIQFTAQVIENAVEGQLGYSFDNGKLTFYTENNTPIDLGRSTYVRVRNNEATTLTKGTIVDFTAVNTGQTPRVKRAIATDGPDCSCFVGIVIQDIPATEFGYIILNGVLDGLDLSAFSNGDQIYLSQTVSGSFTTTIPTPPVKAIRLGMVLNAATSPTQGVLFIRPENRTVVFDLAEFKETYNSGSFSGSFQGDGSGLTGITAEAQTFPFTGSAIISGSLEVIGSIQADELSGSFSGSFQGDGSQLTGITFDISSATSFSTSFTDQTSVTVGHNLNTELPFVQVYDTDDELFIPLTVKVIDIDTVRIDFSETTSGKVVIAKAGHVVQGTLENANSLNGQSGSFYLDYNNFTNIPPAGDSFPYTGSAIITGSLEVIGPISSSGNILPTNLDQDLGSVTAPWRDLYISTASIKFSDGIETVKTLTAGNLVTTESLASQLNDSILTGMEISGSFSGSFQGDGSGLTGIGGDPFPYTGSAIISGSVDIIGTTTTSGSILPAENAIHDLGSDTLRWNTVYTSDLSLKNEYGDWTIVEGEDDLFLYNNKKNKAYKFNLTEVPLSSAPPKKE